ncbi:SDR family NAD(P)-dependent oxidoreductase [Steroidobacter flavus]|uniref:SDR family NAD(P)-dependent oxidoreductase n=1 Tax=Steroidobacter flavus TaxID=1842136 RepID=A0ABV8SVE2_9GAMM
MSISGKTILYTGAAGGLGLATTVAFLDRGATVVAVDNNAEKIAALEAAVPSAARSRLKVLRSNLGDLAAFRSDIEAMAKSVGGYDVVINNAAIYPAKPFEQFTVEEHQAVQRVNVDAGIVAVQVALPSMRAKQWGRIINVSSVTFYGGWALLSPYVASKAALVGLTRAWAREFGEYGVTVNAIAPGAFPTDAEKIHPDPEGYTRFVLERQAVKRRGSPLDIANALAFLASDEAGFITGQTLNVDGGWVMH